MFNRNTSEDLANDEIDALRRSSVNDEIRAYVARRQENLGAETRAFRKVASHARAEREALMEIRALELTQDHVSDAVEYRTKIASLEADNRRLTGEVERWQQQTINATAAPALAIHSSGSRH